MSKSINCYPPRPYSPINPAGKLISVRTLPSTLTCFCMQIIVLSLRVRAYFNRFRRIMLRGKHSRLLCGPALGFGAQMPPIFESIQCLGAFKRFMCFLGPRAILQDCVCRNSGPNYFYENSVPHARHSRPPKKPIRIIH
jgi:hypothetical protein